MKKKFFKLRIKKFLVSIVFANLRSYVKYILYLYIFFEVPNYLQDLYFLATILVLANVFLKANSKKLLLK